ncbi:hypothetical protein [Aquisphaera insulae]|uniref:hypothetical protein n=1 Tax=Aquisphaera insulae TaxID=2712864 RepID=UPI0013EDC560|nr:hypothetical protein [Aquisphaera insulae]
MRSASRIIPTIAMVWLVGLAGFLSRVPAARADGPPSKGVVGFWKVDFLGFGDDELAIIQIEDKDGKRSGKTVSVQKQALGNAAELVMEPVGSDAEAVSFTLKGQGLELRFSGKLARDGAGAGKILGTLTLRGEPYPARLEPTKDEAVGERKASTLVQQYLLAAREAEPKVKAQKLKDLIKKNDGNPTVHIPYTDLLDSAESAGLTADEVKTAIADWQKGAEPYGSAWTKAVRRKALKAISGHKPYAGIAVELAQQVDRETDGQASLEDRAAVVGLLARAATLAGKADLAKEAGDRSAKLEAQLDEEYHRKVPPFKPQVFKGRKDGKADRVVLMELFTGAQCPPCVAADVAFDALLSTFKPAEFIGLQYHLHIPGPDPLTNDDSVARKDYYGSAIRGTPSTFFNGHSQAGGGGPMAFSEGKFNEFREVVEEQLEGHRGATITLTADRIGDVVNIAAAATLAKKPEVAETKKDGETKEGEKKDESKPRLRLALTEEVIRYVGGNKLRYHHHVVRDFPGGVEGKDIASGSGEVKVKLNLADLRREIEEYLSKSAKTRPFPNPLPAVEFKDLSVVAFVQDDSDRKILGAASVPVKVVNP